MCEREACRSEDTCRASISAWWWQPGLSVRRLTTQGDDQFAAARQAGVRRQGQRARRVLATIEQPLLKHEAVGAGALASSRYRTSAEVQPHSPVERRASRVSGRCNWPSAVCGAPSRAARQAERALSSVAASANGAARQRLPRSRALASMSGFRWGWKGHHG